MSALGTPASVMLFPLTLVTVVSNWIRAAATEGSLPSYPDAVQKSVTYDGSRMRTTGATARNAPPFSVAYCHQPRSGKPSLVTSCNTPRCSAVNPLYGLPLP